MCQALGELWRDGVLEKEGTIKDSPDREWMKDWITEKKWKCQAIKKAPLIFLSG